MTTTTRQPAAGRKQPSAAPAKRTITVTAVVDTVGALATRDLGGNLYLYDTNKDGGSTGFGGGALRTSVRAGDQVVWSVLALECEAFVSIDGIRIDPQVCEPERKVYPDTDVAYWVGVVKKDAGLTPYQLSFKVGLRDAPLTAPESPALVAGVAAASPATQGA